MVLFVFIVLSFFSNSSYANEHIVGLLRTQSETYSNELGFSYNIVEMLDDLKTHTILIDYNELVRQKGDLEVVVRSFIKDNNLRHVIIPGNYYNLDAEPFAPNTNRQDVTTILAKMAKTEEIYLMGICGGLQGVMHSEGVEIVKVDNIDGNVDNHLISNPDPHSENVPLHRVRVDPTSRLANIIHRHVDTDEHGWISLYLPDAHSRVVNNSMENIEKLITQGYRVVGFSNDGMIEMIEDSFGNIHFQGHPEGLLISAKNITNLSYLRQISTNAMLVVFQDFINR